MPNCTADHEAIRAKAMSLTMDNIANGVIEPHQLESTVLAYTRWLYDLKAAGQYPTLRREWGPEYR